MGKFSVFWDWRGAFAAAGVAGALGVLIAWTALPRHAPVAVPPRQQSRFQFRAVLRNRDAVALSIGYAAIIASLLAPEGESARLATMAFTLVGFGFSAYLTYRELFSIHAVCEWCASSAGIMTVLAVLSTWRFLRGDTERERGAAAPTGGHGEIATPLGGAS